VSDEKRLTFFEHLAELRTRLRNSVFALLGGIIVAWIFHERLFFWLARPLARAWHDAGGKGVPTLHFMSPIEPLWVYMKISMLAGLFLASPVMFHQLWKFVAPGLYARERRAVLPFVLFSVACFVGGAAFGYFVVFPPMFAFFIGIGFQTLGQMQSYLGGLVKFSTDTPIALQPTIMMDEYLGLAAKTLLGFGVCFELPVLMAFLGAVGIVGHRAMLRFSRYAVVIIAIVAAVVTPDPTALSMILLAVPLCALYFVGVLLAYVLGKRRERATASPSR
jgi:sec-independent protein translocase protein TatC